MIAIGTKLWIWNEEYLLSFNVSRSSLVNAKQTKSKILFTVIISNWFCMLSFSYCVQTAQKSLILMPKQPFRMLTYLIKRCLFNTKLWNSSPDCSKLCYSSSVWHEQNLEKLFFQTFFSVGFHMHVYSRWH